VTKSQERDNGCNWLMRSIKTKKYDLSEVPVFGWKIWTGRVREASFLRIIPADCSFDSDCNYHGTCLPNGRCECDAGWLGKFCRFEDAVCPNIVFYIEDKPVQNFTILLDDDGKVMTAYERPVYYGQRPSGEFIVILYTGRRWFVTLWDDESDLSSAVDHIRFGLSNPFFHAYWSQIYDKNTVVFSAPTESLLPVSDEVQWDILGVTKSKGDFGTFGFWKCEFGESAFL